MRDLWDRLDESSNGMWRHNLPLVDGSPSLRARSVPCFVSWVTTKLDFSRPRMTIFLAIIFGSLLRELSMRGSLFAACKIGLQNVATTKEESDCDQKRTHY